MNTKFLLIRRSFSGNEKLFGEFSSQDAAAAFYRDTIKVNPRFDSFFVVDKVGEGRTVRALIFNLVKNLEN